MTMLNQIDIPWQTDPSLGKVPNSFRLFQEQFLKPLGKIITNIEREEESAEYGAIRFEMDGMICLYRQAKHTPKKIGQFVTLWKRPTPSSEIAPFDREDGIDRVIIFADEHPRFGVFILLPQKLVKKDIFSKQSEGGKRAFRVYAPWTVPLAVQAKRSKVWQCAHFAELTDTKRGLAQLVKML
ncbi:MepB family protein [Acinetobacter pollinis]|uniref:MepB family protein n=2 Tax=Acinetobacter pollinis TaxID=2605270 RepID=A0ABU6DUL2_9GAMM|nr:MepB family protein [Acinetobacter pollinis]